MFGVPYDRFTVHSHLNKDQLMSRLSPMIERRGSFFLGPAYDALEGGYEGVCRFRGRVGNEGFRIFPLVKYRNAFLPVIHGTFLSTPDKGTDVVISLALHPFIAVFVLGWLLSAGLLAALPSEGVNTRVIGVAMFFLGGALTLGGFWSEAGRAKRILSEGLSDA